MKRNFTLIELLVVIGVIAVLAALLLPALSSSRSKARRIQDLSNMKQIGTGLHAYSDASKGYMPCVHSVPENGRLAYCTEANAAWAQFDEFKVVGLGLLFAGGYVASPKVFFCTEPYFDGSSYFTYDNPDNGWVNWKHPGKSVHLSMSIPIRLYSKGDLAAAKAGLDPAMSEYPMSNILSDNAKKVVLTCYGYKYSSGDKPPHDGDGVNMIFGDNSGRWQRIDESAVAWLADDKSRVASRLFAWLNAHANR